MQACEIAAQKAREIEYPSQVWVASTPTLVIVNRKDVADPAKVLLYLEAAGLSLRSRIVAKVRGGFFERIVILTNELEQGSIRSLLRERYRAPVSVGRWVVLDRNMRQPEEE